jgi:hypothetical protein
VVSRENRLTLAKSRSKLSRLIGRHVGWLGGMIEQPRSAVIEGVPHYGWGWFDEQGNKPVHEIPAGFILSVEILSQGSRFSAVGYVDSPTHKFHGLWVALLQRHTK